MENQTTSNGPRDVFFHLLGFATLYASAISLLALWFGYIEHLWPDVLTYYNEGVFGSIRLSSSILLVTFPVFVFTFWKLSHFFVKDPILREARFRRWLIYFTLFIAAATIIVDLILLIFNFYGGELTAQFVFKILAVLIVAFSVFGYYFLELRSGKSPASAIFRPQWWAISASVLVVVSLAAGFFIVGSPAKQRQIRFDQQRVYDLQNLQGQIVRYWQQKGAMPQESSELNDSLYGFVTPLDPQTGLAYEYRVLEKLTFELCANFNTANHSNQNFKDTPYPRGGYLENQFWGHDQGRFCFTRTIDQDLYPLQNPQRPEPTIKF